MRNDSRSGQMRSVAQRVSIADSYDMKVITNGRSNRRINAKVSGPPRHQDSTRSHSRKCFCEVRFNVRIIQSFLDYQIVVSMVQFGEEFPLRLASLKKIACFTAMPNPNNLTTFFPDHKRKRIDAIDHLRQIVLGCALQQPDLHVNYDECIHDTIPD